MKPVLRFPGQRSIGYVVAVYAVVIVLVILWAAQLLGTVTGDNPGQTPALLTLSLVFPAALLAISVFNVARVVPVGLKWSRCILSGFMVPSYRYYP